jgi:cytochrome c
MKPGCLTVASLTLLAALASALTAGRFSPAAGQEPSADPGVEALKKAVETGNALFRDTEFGTNGRACARCHEDPAKPEMNLARRAGNYPKWDRREEKVITLGQKILQMHTKMLKGRPEPLGSEKLVAVEAYLMSISRQAD